MSHEIKRLYAILHTASSHFQLPCKDSNPDIESQNLSYYHYTTRQKAAAKIRNQWSSFVLLFFFLQNKKPTLYIIGIPLYRELTWPDGGKEVVHTYGWYIKKFISDAKAKGATPIVLTMIPRNEFRDGKVRQATNDYSKWAKESAEQGGPFFIDLNAIILVEGIRLNPKIELNKYLVKQ